MFKLFKRKRKVILKKYWVVVQIESGKKFSLTIEAVDRDHLLNQVDAAMRDKYKIVDFGLE